jgi:hypothetical protein
MIVIVTAEFGHQLYDETLKREFRIELYPFKGPTYYHVIPNSSLTSNSIEKINIFAEY